MSQQHGCSCIVCYLMIAHSILALELSSLMFDQCGLKSLQHGNLLCSGARVQVRLRTDLD